MAPTNYITGEGAKALRMELDQLWCKERPRVTQEVMEAAAQGDRSENAEYIYGKKRLREIDRRVRFLSKRLDALTVVDRAPPRSDKVFFGAWVKLLDQDDNEATYRVVGPDEFDLKTGKISIDSPMGRSLMGKQLDDDIVVKRPKGDATFTIVEIWY